MLSYVSLTVSDAVLILESPLLDAKAATCKGHAGRDDRTRVSSLSK